MISDKNLVFYTCIARGKTILGEFLARDCGILETLGQQCIDVTPPNHSVFSHTACRKTYTFLIHDPFVFFGIFDENLLKSESLWLLNRVKSSFEESGLIFGVDGGKSHCLQAQFNSIFEEIMPWGTELGTEFAVPSTNEYSESRRSSMDSSMENNSVGMASLLRNPSQGLMKKKKRFLSERESNFNGDVKDTVMMENKVDVCDDMSMHKMGLYMGDNRQKAKQTWKKHVWIVLVLDLFVCAALFGIWLWVCRGFQCIDG